MVATGEGWAGVLPEAVDACVRVPRRAGLTFRCTRPDFGLLVLAAGTSCPSSAAHCCPYLPHEHARTHTCMFPSSSKAVVGMRLHVCRCGPVTRPTAVPRSWCGRRWRRYGSSTCRTRAGVALPP